MTPQRACRALDRGAGSRLVVIDGAILAAGCRPLPFACRRFKGREQDGSTEPVIGPVHRGVSQPSGGRRLMGQRAGAGADLSAGR
jgi:hypothetical protein